MQQADHIKPLRRVARLLLDSQRPAHSLRPEVLELTGILAGAQAIRTARSEDISRGETRTSNGLAISPSMATMCAEDFVRTIAFLRGTHAAIVDLRTRWPDRPIRVLYAGCGPWATLAVPLMAVVSSTEATFTLLDLHPESVASAKSIVATLGLASSVTSFETVDIASYQVCPDAPPDILLIETMQACLEAEPQVAITWFLLKQSPQAILIPEQVRIDMTWTDPAHDCFGVGQELNRSLPQRDRFRAAPVFVLDREIVQSWDGFVS